LYLDLISCMTIHGWNWAQSVKFEGWDGPYSPVRFCLLIAAAAATIIAATAATIIDTADSSSRDAAVAIAVAQPNTPLTVLEWNRV